MLLQVKKTAFTLLSLSCLLLHFASAQTLRKRSATLMGSRFDIVIVDKDSASADADIDAVIKEVARIEDLISDWRPYTQVSQVNQNAGIRPVKVDKEVIELTKRGLAFSKLTNGAFDISFAAMDRIWKFDGSMKKMPTPEEIKKSVVNVNYQDVIVNEDSSTIFLKRIGMKIGFGALGEGYAADKCKKMMMEKGVIAGIVNGSGDMNTWGNQPDGSPWNIGITDPKDPTEIMAVVPLKKGAVVTSGSYEKYVTFNNKRYAHIINPRTGYPATGLVSVTVFGPSAEQANGLSTSIMVMGKEKGLKLLKKFPQMSCVIIGDDGSLYASPSLHLKDYMIDDESE